MQQAPQIILNSRAGNFNGQHPWVLEKSIIEPTAPLEAGTVTDLVLPSGQFVGRGIYNPHSRIRLRLYQWQESEQLDSKWLRKKLLSSVQMREMWMQTNGTLDAIRLVNSEGDGLSGLVVDRFGDYIVIQPTALAIHHWLDDIAAWLNEYLQPKAILVRTDGKMAAHEGMPELDQTLIGQAPQSPIEVCEGGVRLQLDLANSQKTGYYLDQRANRQRLAQWVRPGAMLDVCTYLGGFALAACLSGKPTRVVAVDSSQRALDAASRNANLNGCSKIEFVQADCFDYLTKLQREGSKFQTVVLDPPRMASSRSNVQSALRAYHRLNTLALDLLESNGILVTCSCSGRVSREDFAGMLGSVASKKKRALQIIESHGADFDHPIAANCPESEYLKCFICRVT